eukprot:6068172-Pyramimonas_sp.AAC.1
MPKRTNLWQGGLALKKRAISSIVDAGGSISAAVTSSCSRGSEGRSALLKAVYEDQKEIAKADTPYGPVVQSISLPLENGNTFEAEFVHPMALIHYIAHRSGDAARFFRDYVGNRTGTMTMHVDDAKCGNNQRPDKGRSF